MNRVPLNCMCVINLVPARRLQMRLRRVGDHSAKQPPTLANMFEPTGELKSRPKLFLCRAGLTHKCLHPEDGRRTPPFTVREKKGSAALRNLHCAAVL